MEDYLQQLNEQQRQAVTYLDGPQLVIAGAGSGKTRVLTYKIVHLLAHGYEPWRIMALTFTNKAAREMRSRISALVGDKIASRLWMGTFHSIFAKILRIHADRLGYPSDYTIYDTSDSRSLLKTIIRDMNLDEKVYKPNTIHNSISAAKNALISPADYVLDRDLTDYDRHAGRPMTAEIYRVYVDRCRVAGAMDFDDLLFNMNVLLRDNEDILRHYQEFFRYVLVDEYQDTNFAQHLIVSRLTQQTQALCVVGDDAQSIYSFRGANIRNILNLRRAYPNLEISKLEQNYRSTRFIVDAANSLIAKNEHQMPKHVFSRGDEGERIEVAKAYTDFEEGSLVANRISQVKMATGDSYEDFAILYRTNAQSRILEEALRRRNIPYRIYGGLAFYQRKEIKDALAYMRLSVNPDDDEALKRIINEPARGIGETTLSKLTNAAINARVSIKTVLDNPQAYEVKLNNGILRKLGDFATMLDDFTTMQRAGTPADELATHIIKRTGLLAQYISDSTPESISKQENLQELLNGVGQFVQEKTEEGSESVTMTDFLQEVSLATDQDSDDPDTQERVTLMTIHAAKGLEFGNVFIVGVEENLLPSYMSINSPDDVEEERRLLYVAITRAKRFCWMSYASSRFMNGKTQISKPSRFLRDIDPIYMRPVQGASVVHQAHEDTFKRSFHSPVGKTPTGGYGSRSTTFVKPQSPAATPVRQAPKPAGQAAAGGMSIHASSELAEGMNIEHSTFGHGIITAIDVSQADHRITVDFGDGTPRKLLLKFAKFRIV